MNWYKKSQQLEVVDTRDLKGRGRHYTGIAHDVNYGEQNRLLGFDPNENYSIDDPNILWVYNNGQIETRPETQANQTHRSRGNWDLNSNLDRLYTGRYSPSENIITLIPPHEGMGRYREIPEQLKFLLKQKFPKAVDIYNYASSKSWYKKAQQREQWQYDEDTVLDYHEEHNMSIMDQVNDFNTSKPGERQSWRLIPAGRLKKIWADHARMGFVRDVKGIEMIQDIIVENVKKVHANTILMGHTSEDPEDLLKDNEMTINETDEHDYGNWATDDETGAWRISDYALEKLINGSLELVYAKTPEEKLQKIDWILNVVHQRSDIAAWFVEGGTNTLDELSNQVI